MVGVVGDEFAGFHQLVECSGEGCVWHVGYLFEFCSGCPDCAEVVDKCGQELLCALGLSTPSVDRNGGAACAVDGVESEFVAVV